MRYSAPEILDRMAGAGRDYERGPTKKSDIYSLSMVITEVRLFYESEMCPGSDRSRFQLATGKMPFSELPDPNIPVMVLKGKRPAKPRTLAPGMTPAVWKITKKCWNEKPKDRPEADTVLRYLEDAALRGSAAGVSDERAPAPFRQLWRGVFSG